MTLTKLSKEILLLLSSLIITLNTTNSEGSCCSVCLDLLNEKQQAIKHLEYCSHVFHKECIETWENTANTCPCCREAIQKTFHATYRSKKNNLTNCILDLTAPDKITLTFQQLTKEINYTRIRTIHLRNNEIWFYIRSKNKLALEKFIFRSTRDSLNIYNLLKTSFNRLHELSK